MNGTQKLTCELTLRDGLGEAIGFLCLPALRAYRLAAAVDFPNPRESGPAKPARQAGWGPVCWHFATLNLNRGSRR